jgi:hypothetical protein
MNTDEKMNILKFQYKSIKFNKFINQDIIIQHTKYIIKKIIQSMHNKPTKNIHTTI